MKIVIHGTKGGYHIFTPDEIKKIDARPDVNKVAAIGQQAYAIHFDSGNVVFSKYKIIRDVIGDKRTGNVAFSVVVPNNEKLPGESVLKLLDKIEKGYSSKYISGDNLVVNGREDWDFVETFTAEYKKRLKTIPEDDREDYSQGTGEAAYVYYATEEDLPKYFETPYQFYQKEYEPYRQVFFVDKKHKENPTYPNPLDALRHNPKGDITDKIDLTNLRYKLKDFRGKGKYDVKIEIKFVDDINCNPLKDKDIIKNKDTICIKYSNECYKSIEEEGKILDHDIAKYLTVNNKNNKITVKDDVTLTPIEKDILLKVKDRSKGAVSFPPDKINCKNGSGKKKDVSNNKLHFEGKELKDRWTITAQDDKLITKQSVEFTPNDLHTCEVLVVLQKYKKVAFQVLDDNEKPVQKYKMQIKNEQRNKDIINDKDGWWFYDDGINQEFKIIITHPKYKTKTFLYCPASGENMETVKLRSKNYVYYGTIFKKWLHKKTKKFWIFSAIVLIIFTVAAILILIFNSNKQRRTEEATERQERRQAFRDSLNSLNNKKIDDHLNSLRNYKAHYTVPPEIEIKKGILPLFFSLFGEKQRDSTEYKEWETTCKMIDSAIKTYTKAQEEAKFWELVKNRNAKMNDYSNLLNSYKYHDEIIDYLKEICKDQKSFEKFKKIPKEKKEKAIKSKSIDEIRIK